MSTSPAAWHPDSTGRHHLRYFDGTKWTDHATTRAGAQTLDPVQSVVTESVVASSPSARLAPPAVAATKSAPTASIGATISSLKVTKSVNKLHAFRFGAIGIALMLTLVACGGGSTLPGVASASTSSQDPSSVSSPDLSSGANPSIAAYQAAVLPSLDSIITTSHDLAAAVQQGDATQASIDCDSDQSDAEAILQQQQTVGVAPDSQVADDIKTALDDFAKASQTCDDLIDSGVINSLNDGGQHIDSARRRILQLSGIPDSSGG